MTPGRAPKTPPAAQSGTEPGGAARTETAVAGASPRVEHRKPPVEAEDGSVDIRLAGEDARVVDEVARREIIRSVGHDVVGPDDLQGILGAEARLVAYDLHAGVQGVEPRLGFGELRLAHRTCREQDLPLEVFQLHGVAVREADRADARGGQVEAQRRAEPAGSDHQHARVLELLLPSAPTSGKTRWRL